MTLVSYHITCRCPSAKRGSAAEAERAALRRCCCRYAPCLQTQTRTTRWCRRLRISIRPTGSVTRRPGAPQLQQCLCTFAVGVLKVMWPIMLNSPAAWQPRVDEEVCDGVDAAACGVRRWNRTGVRSGQERVWQPQLRGCSSRRGPCAGTHTTPGKEEVCAAAGGHWAAVIGVRVFGMGLLRKTPCC